MEPSKSAFPRLANCFIIFMLLWSPTLSAVVAQEKVKELVQQIQMRNDSSQSDNLHFLELRGSKERGEIAQPLSLQLEVLDLTNSLNREMNLPKWHAMLRALGGDREILKRFAQMRPYFTELEGLLKQGHDEGIEGQLDRLAALNTSSTWTRVWPQLQTLINTVANLHDWFDRYQRNSAVVNERTLLDYAKTVHGNDGLTISKALESIHEEICPFDLKDDFGTTGNNSAICHGGILEILQDALAKADESFICSLAKSPQQLIYELYSFIALTDAKGFAMMQFSWMLLRLYERANYVTESDKARATYEIRVIEKAEAAQRVLTNVSNWMWNCDTSEFHQIENETYIQFSELLQGYVVNEVDLNQDNTCKESCSAYTNSQEKSCFGNQFCAQSRRCSSGRIYNCGFIEADSNVCISNKPGRRYDWIEYKSGRTFGTKTDCNALSNKTTKANSWWRWVFWHCSYCMCLCDQPGKHSDRYVSLQSALSTTSSNRLITGIRLIKRNRIVHIQIQEGEALPKGLVNESTVNWKPVVPVQIHKDHEDSIEDGLGYATLNYEERALDLDDLHVPKGYVITGLRFRKLGGHLNLEIQASPIDFASGQIDAERAIWLSNDNTPAAETKPRTKVSLYSPDVPTNCKTSSLPDSLSDQFIEFQASSLEKDVSQTTVPFLEAIPVLANPPTWLTGVGIYHKGQPGCGGYVAFRIATLNLMDYLTFPSKTISYTSNEEANSSS